MTQVGFEPTISAGKRSQTYALDGAAPGTGLFVLTVPKLNQHLMHSVSYTKSRCLTDTPTRFSARWRHLQEVPYQLLTCQNVRSFQTHVRTNGADERRNASDY